MTFSELSNRIIRDNIEGTRTRQPRLIDIDFREFTITRIHEAYHNGDYTSERLVGAYLQRIEA